MPSISMPVMPGGMPGDPSMSSQPAREPHGITLTTRQLVGMLVMTALLAGVIGALVTLPCLQRNPDSRRGPATAASGCLGARDQAASGCADATPSTETRPVGAVDKPAGTGAVQTPVVPVTAKPATSLYILRGETKLPLLRAERSRESVRRSRASGPDPVDPPLRLRPPHQPRSHRQAPSPVHQQQRLRSGQASSPSGNPSSSNACQARCHTTRYARGQARDPRRQAPRR